METSTITGSSESITPKSFTKFSIDTEEFAKQIAVHGLKRTVQMIIEGVTQTCIEICLSSGIDAEDLSAIFPKIY